MDPNVKAMLFAALMIADGKLKEAINSAKTTREIKDALIDVEATIANNLTKLMHF